MTMHIERRVPLGVGSVLHQAPVEIWSTVVPPDRSAFTQRALGVVDSSMRDEFRIGIRRLLRVSDRPPRRHQARHETAALGFAKFRVRHPPETPSDDKVTTVLCHRMSHTQADLRRAPAAGFFAAVSFDFFPAIGISISF